MTTKSIRFHNAITAFVFLFAGVMSAALFSSTNYRLLYDVKSKYSHIKITDENGIRTLWFVRDSGEEVVESQVDIHAPHKLILDYTRVMFASMLINPNMKCSLFIGLGGGAMVNFTNHYFPSIHLDVVEIDPVILSVAKKYFCLKPNSRTKIFTGDGYAFISGGTKHYDAIFMDAFLKPSSVTDATGVPTNMKTAEFYNALKKRLTKDGVVVFNINQYDNDAGDIQEIKKAFKHTYIFRNKGSGNIIVIGSTSSRRLAKKEIIKNGSQLDSYNSYYFLFSKIATYLED